MIKTANINTCNFNSKLSSKKSMTELTVHWHTGKFISIRHSTLFKEQTKLRGISWCYCYLAMSFTKGMTTFRGQRADIWVLCFSESWNYDRNFPHAVSITKFPVSIGNIQLTTTCKKGLTIKQCTPWWFVESFIMPLWDKHMNWGQWNFPNMQLSWIKVNYKGRVWKDFINHEN